MMGEMLSVQFLFLLIPFRQFLFVSVHASRRCGAIYSVVCSALSAFAHVISMCLGNTVFLSCRRSPIVVCRIVQLLHIHPNAVFQYSFLKVVCHLVWQKVLWESYSSKLLIAHYFISSLFNAVPYNIKFLLLQLAC